MRNRFAAFILLVVTMLLLAGCPPRESIAKSIVIPAAMPEKKSASPDV